MTRLFNSAFLMLLAAVAVWVAPTAKADEWDKRTILTFNEPVEIPGQVLAPGTYVFKLADTIDRTTVNVYTADEQHLIAMIMAVPAYRLELTSNTALTFKERAGGSPQAVHDWFYPGDHNGIEFVYPKAGARPTVAQTEPAPARAVAPVETPDPTPAPEPEQEAQAQPAEQEQPPVAVREEEILVAQAVPPVSLDNGIQNVPPAPEELPHTASNVALAPLAGIVLLFGGFAALRFSTKQI